MPRFNNTGAVTPQIGYFWYDQSRFIFQDCSTGVCKIVLSDGTLIAPTGTVRLLANGAGAWAYVEYPGHPVEPEAAVYRDSFGRTRTNCYPNAIAPNGAICVKPHSNIGATVLEPDGSEWTLSTEDAQDIQLLSGRRALWTVRGVVQANFPLIGNPGTVLYWPRAADDGTLLYQALDGRLVLGGKVIAPTSSSYFYPDVALIGGAYRVCWSPSQADVNAQFLTVTPAELASLPPLSTLPPPIVTPPVTPIPPPVTPKPEPKPVMPTVPAAEISRAQSVLATVRSERNFGANQEPLPYVKAVAQRLGYPWGLNGKRGDANNPSGDILAYDFPGQQPQLYDTLGDAGGANVPTFSALDYPQPAGAVFIRVEGTTSQPPVVGTPPAPTSTGPGAALDAELKALLTRLVAAENRIAELAARPQPTPQPAVNLNGVRVALRTSDGHYLCAEGGGGGEVNATRTGVGGWETYTVEVQQ